MNPVQHDAPPLDCVIVGAGPAGLTAAIYLQRFGRRIQLIDAGGGRALKISRSRNCPGFPAGIAGAELIERLRQQLQSFGGAVTSGQVAELSRRADGLFGLQLLNQDARLLSRTVLLCTGVQDRLPALPGIAELCAADRLRQCPICDGYEHRGQKIGVLGGSEHAAREAEFLRDLGADVVALTLEESDGSSPVQQIAFDDRAVLVTMGDGSTQRFDVLYAALGVTPRVTLARQLDARLDATGNIVVDAHCRSSVEGLYAAGDVVSALDQIAVAFGHSAIAATALHNDLRAQRRKTERRGSPA